MFEQLAELAYEVFRKQARLSWPSWDAATPAIREAWKTTAFVIVAKTLDIQQTGGRG